MLIVSIALLFAQANFDLALPDYLSRIVNTGIQQGGVENAIPEAIRQSQMERVLIFIDAEKESYIDYYNLCLPKLKKGGVLIADNVLWDGKVYDKSFNNDITTKAIKQFNKLVQDDPQVENMILPLRDGLMVGRKVLEDRP